jgi:hypothetical protein
MKKGSTMSFKLNPKKLPKSDWRAFAARVAGRASGSDTAAR